MVSENKINITNQTQEAFCQHHDNSLPSVSSPSSSSQKEQTKLKELDRSVSSDTSSESISFDSNNSTSTSSRNCSEPLERIPSLGEGEEDGLSVSETAADAEGEANTAVQAQASDSVIKIDSIGVSVSVSCDSRDKENNETINETQSSSVSAGVDPVHQHRQVASTGPVNVNVATVASEFVPCSQKSFNGASILLAAQQHKQELENNSNKEDNIRKNREEAIRSELQVEEQRKRELRAKLQQQLNSERKEEVAEGGSGPEEEEQVQGQLQRQQPQESRLFLVQDIIEQHLRVEEHNQIRELQRRQQQQQLENLQRLEEERQRQEQERRKQQLVEHKQKLEEERQKRELIKQQEFQRKREEASRRAQKVLEDNIRRRKEEKQRLERQCDFPVSTDQTQTQMQTHSQMQMQGANMNVNNNAHAQNLHHDARGHVPNSNGQGHPQQQSQYPYHYTKRNQQHARSGTMSSGETPLKPRSGRNHNPNHQHRFNSERSHQQQHMNINAADTPTLFFERIVNEEVAEIKSYTEIIQNQNREIIELKNTNNEMESRLEYQTRERIDLEATIEKQEVHWDEQCMKLAEERDELMKALQTEKTTNEKLWDVIYAKEKEIQRAYQRRYDAPVGHRRGPHHKHSPADARNLATSRAPAAAHVAMNAHRSPLWYLKASSTDQERAAVQLLEGFFGF